MHVRGIDNYDINSILLVTHGRGRVTTTVSDAVIDTMSQYPCYGKVKPIQYSYKIEHFNNSADMKSIKVSRTKYVTTNNGYKFPISIFRF